MEQNYLYQTPDQGILSRKHSIYIAIRIILMMRCNNDWTFNNNVILFVTMNVPCRRLHLVDHNPDKNPDHNLDSYSDNYAPCKRFNSQFIIFLISLFKAWAQAQCMFVVSRDLLTRSG